MRSYTVIILFSFLFVVFACKKKDEQLSMDPELDLGFSMDTVIFDTVFTDVLTVTKRLKVTNRAKNAVNIDHIYVNPNSPYSLIVNGEETNDVQNMFLRGGDSFLILVKAVLGKNNTAGAFVVEDSIQFITNSNNQSVKLISWGRDAIFHSREVVCDEIWTSEKPHIIYDFAIVPSDCSLTIEAGAEVYVHGGGAVTWDFGQDFIVPMYGPGLIIGGQLLINGTTGNRVTISDDRLEEGYEHRPGMWGEIQFLNSSNDCEINYCDISNANIGVRIGKLDADNDPDLIMRNTLIRDMRYIGIQSWSADVNMENCVITNCAQHSADLAAGGTYNINHCTFAEYDFEFTRSDDVASLKLSNFVQFQNGASIGSDLKFAMSNSIVWGEKGNQDEVEEVLLPPSGGGYLYVANFFDNNRIRSTHEDVINGGLTLNLDPGFVPRDSIADHYNFNLVLGASSIDNGKGTSVIDDFTGYIRSDGKSDIGAYEFH